MPDLDLSDLSAIDSSAFAKIVKSASDAQLSEVMQGEQRDRVISEVFSRMPGYFRPDRAGGTSAVIHWIITGRPDGGSDTYQVVIENGACALSDSADREPKLALTLGPVEFLKVVTSNANPVMMFMTGKLKATGDLGLAANISNLFDLPKA